MKPKHFIIIGIIIALIAGGIVVKQLSKDVLEDIPYDAIGNSSGNIHNGGYFCESDGKVYFANSFDNNAMYVMNPDETEIKKVIKQAVKQINVYGSHMYYYQTDNRSGADLGSVIKASGLYRARTDGEHITGLKRGVYGNILLTGSALYYQFYDSSSAFLLYSMDIDGENETIRSDVIIDPACAIGGNIYYAGTDKDHNLYRMDLRSGDTTTVAAGNYWNPTYDGGYLYFQDLANGYQLYRMNLSSGEISLVAPYRTESFNVGSGYVFFTVSALSGQPCLMRIDADGNNPVILSEGNFCNLSVTSQYLYYNDYQTGELYHCRLYSDYPERFVAAQDAAVLE